MFNALFYKPLYNALVYLSSIVPGNNIGVAIIVLTLLVKLILLPLYKRAAVTQIQLKKIEPEIERLKVVYKDNRDEQTRRILDLYRTNKINPFVSFLVILIQFPVVIALFWVFRGNFTFDPHQLYSFVSVPAHIGLTILGVSIIGKNLILALLTGLTQFIQMQISLPPMPKRDVGSDPTFKDDFARSLNLNLKYLMPAFIVYIAYNLSAAVSLYWVTSNLFSIGQEFYIRKKLNKKAA